MTTTNDIIEKLNQAMLLLEPGNIEACEAINEAILLVERERMERKRAQFMAAKEKVIFFRRQAS